MGSLFTFPENDEKISDWLEALLLSPDFGAAISQIADFKPEGLNDQTKSLSAEELDKLSEIGLSQLSVEQCRWLLRNPKRLVELNEKVFEVGSPYWMGKLQGSASDAPILKEVSNSISQFDSTAAATSQSQSKSDSTGSVQLSRRSFFQTTTGKLVALAASLMFIAVAIPAYKMFTDTGNSQWGWQNVSLAKQDSRELYFGKLDQSLAEWFDVSKGSKELLAKRLEQFSDGCDRLINAEHDSLSQSDQDWLLEKCEAWKVTIDELVASAKQANDDQQVARIKNSADDLVTKISLAFKNRIETT